MDSYITEIYIDGCLFSGPVIEAMSFEDAELIAQDWSDEHGMKLNVLGKLILEIENYYWN